MEKLVIGIDFSKETLNYCCLQGASNRIIKEGIVNNNQSGCKDMIRMLRELRPKACVSDFLFCGENTGCYSLEVSDYLFSKKYVMWLENPLQVKLSSGIRREKTDKVDARMIAEYAFRYQDKVKPYNPQTESIQELRYWLKTHDALKESRKSLINLSRTMKHVPHPLQKSIDELNEQLKQTDKKIKELLKKDDELAANAQLAMSVPGLSYVTTAAILVDTRNFTRFTDARKYANHTGCVPHKYSSGSSVYRRPHVSKTSNRYINSLLTEGSVSLMTHNKEMREYAEKKRREGKSNGCIINNIRNKTLHRLFAVIRNKSLFDKDYQHVCQKKALQCNYTS